MKTPEEHATKHTKEDKCKIPTPSLKYKPLKQ